MKSHLLTSSLCALFSLFLLLAASGFGKHITEVYSNLLFVKRSPIYLPEVANSKLLSFGHSSLLGKVLWFNLLDYFGKEYSNQRDYTWLKHMCQLVTELDPKAPHYYRLCATLLAWEVKDTEASSGILDKAMVNFPDDYYFAYQKGFNKWYFEENIPEASQYFELAAKKTNAPPFVASIASKLLTATGRVDSAIKFLSEELKRAETKSTRDSLTHRLNQAILTRDLNFLNEAVRRYQARFAKEPSSLNDLVTGTIITRLPVEPFGRSYKFKNGEVISTSGESPLEFKGKTAKTGLMKDEF